MSENKTSVFYSIAAGSSLAVFALAMAGLFLPLVKVNGETITIYETISQIFAFIRDFRNATIDKALALSGIIRNAVVISVAVSLFFRIIFSFFSYLFKNIRNIIHPNDFYGEDMIRVSLHIAFFTAIMFAYYPEWHYSIGMVLMNIASILGILIVGFLRITEALRSDRPVASFIHAVLMILASALLYSVIFYGMMSPVAVKNGGLRIALVDNVTNYVSNMAVNFTTDLLVAFILEILAVGFIFRSLASMQNSCLCTLGCVPRRFRKRRKHVQREYHLRAIIHAILGLVFFTGGIILAIAKSEEAFGVEYTIGTSGILGIVGLVLAIALVITAKLVRPGLNTYEHIKDEENATKSVA